MEEQVSPCTSFFPFLLRPCGSKRRCRATWRVDNLSFGHRASRVVPWPAVCWGQPGLGHLTFCSLPSPFVPPSTRGPILCHPSGTNRETNPKSMRVPCYHIHLMKQTDNIPKWKASPGGGLQPAKAHLTFSLPLVPVFDLAICAHFQNIKELN